jgi:hypothetical protein
MHVMQVDKSTPKCWQQAIFEFQNLGEVGDVIRPSSQKISEVKLARSRGSTRFSSSDLHIALSFMSDYAQVLPVINVLTSPRSGA